MWIWALRTSIAGARRRVEKRGRFDVGEKLVIPQEKVLDLVKQMQEKTKVEFKNSGFVPNWANKIVSQRDRQMKAVALVEALEKEAKEGLEMYDFLEVMACMERQMKGARVGKYMPLNRLLMMEDTYVRQSINEKVFDDLEKQRNGQNKEEEKEEEVKGEKVEVKEEEEVKEEVEIKEEVEVKEEVEIKEEVEVKEVTVESLLVFVGWMVDT